VPPCLLFIGIYLMDLTFVDVGNPANVIWQISEGDALVNFDRYAKTAKVVGELQHRFHST
jgi:hypothetical protein